MTWIPITTNWNDAYIETINPNFIECDDMCQPRLDGIDTTVVDEYADIMQENDWESFPFLRCVKTNDDRYILVSGFHRLAAIIKIGYVEIKVQCIDGTYQDAVMLSKQENIDHGIRRTNADKEHVVISCLRDKELRKWSNAQIAKWCGVSDRAVTNYEKKLVSETFGDVSYERPTKRQYLRKDGTIAHKDTSAIGKRTPDTKAIQKDIQAGKSFLDIANKHGTTATEVMKVSNKMNKPDPKTEAIRIDIEQARTESDNGNGGGVNGVKYAPIAEKHNTTVEKVVQIATGYTPDKPPIDITIEDIQIKVRVNSKQQKRRLFADDLSPEMLNELIKVLSL